MPYDQSAGLEGSAAQIVGVAIEVLQTKGPAHLTAREIARRAGISVSLINHHFGGKEALMEQCLSRLYEALAAEESQWRRRIEEADEARLGELCASVAEAGYRFGCRWRPLVRYGWKRVAERGGLPPVWRDAVQEPLLSTWGRLLAERSDFEASLVRLRLHAAVTHIARLAIASETDLHALVGEGDIDEIVVGHVRSLGAFVCGR
ncbi:MAG: TetR/AcrR family transcriptional regulator [Myxococcota bacterium]